MTAILNMMRKINRFGVWMGGGLMILTSFLIAIEVILRKLFSISIGGSDELSSYVLAIGCSWAFGFALMEKAHIRIDILYARLSERLRIFLDLFSLVVFLCYAVPLGYFSALVFQTSLVKNSTANTPLQTPLWIPQGIWLLGLLVFLLTMVVLILTSVNRLVRGDIQGALAISGPTSLEEEIEEGIAVSTESNPQELPQ
ncbi:MAG: TRAP transporter small permease [Desulfuromonadales bacterium]|nr:TRAP transporter small permease [Desulfuromonadales bacterium]MBN2793547.1 TRAP transporter small permease [Desulfuromonadales bacterium]